MTAVEKLFADHVAGNLRGFSSSNWQRGVLVGSAVLNEKIQDLFDKAVLGAALCMDDSGKVNLEAMCACLAFYARELRRRKSPCFNCGKESRNACAGCRAAVFCSRKCQREQWGYHKNMCKMLAHMEQNLKREHVAIEIKPGVMFGAHKIVEVN